MQKNTLFIVIAIAATLVIAGVVVVYSPGKKNEPTANNSGQSSNAGNQTSQDTGGTADLTNQPEITMDIKDFMYQRPDIKIKKDTRVTWINQDIMRHNVMLEHEGSHTPHDPPAASKVDPNELAGPLLAKGESYSFTFNEAGAYPYHCSPHPQMKGIVTVVE